MLPLLPLPPQVDDISYVGVDGCCNRDPAPSGKFPLNGDADAATAGLPYIQLLTCLSEVSRVQGGGEGRAPSSRPPSPSPPFR